MNHIKELKPLEKNPRKHNARNIGVIADGLNEVGAARSIVIDEDNVILAGNGTVEAASQAGFSKVKVVDADGETIIAVRRKGLSEEQKKRLALIDNRSSDLGSYDAAILAEYEAESVRLSDLFTPAELQRQYDQDTSFLDSFIGAGHSEAGSTPDASPSGADVDGTASEPGMSGSGETANSETVTLLFVVTPEQRSEIMRVLNALASERNLPTSGAALHALVMERSSDV